MAVHFNLKPIMSSVKDFIARFTDDNGKIDKAKAKQYIETEQKRLDQEANSAIYKQSIIDTIPYLDPTEQCEEYSNTSTEQLEKYQKALDEVREA